MNKLSKSFAIVFAISLAIVTVSLYVIGVRDDMRDQEELNQRLKAICDQARNANQSKELSSEFLKRYCKNLAS